MKSEQYLRELLADIDLVNEETFAEGPSVFTAFRHGISSGIAEALDLRVELCGNPECKIDHEAVRAQGLADIRKRAAQIRSERAAEERATRQ